MGPTQTSADVLAAHFPQPKIGTRQLGVYAEAKLDRWIPSTACETGGNDWEDEAATYLPPPPQSLGILGGIQNISPVPQINGPWDFCEEGVAPLDPPISPSQGPNIKIIILAPKPEDVRRVIRYMFAGSLVQGISSAPKSSLE